MPKFIPSDFTETEIYRRHIGDCKNPNRCKCPCWLYGYIRGKRVRESLKTGRMDVAIDRQKRREGRAEYAAPAPAAPVAPEKAPEPDCSIEDAVQKYLAWARVNSVSDNTVTQYAYNFGHFSQFCAAHKIRSVRALTKPLMNDFVLSLVKYSANTRVAHFCQLRTFFGYLRGAGLMGEDPLPFRGPRKPRRGAHRPLEQEEQRRILAACQTPEERTLILLMLGTGLRGVDARKMRLAYLDSKRRVLRMTPQKTEETSGEEVIIPKIPLDLIAAVHALPRSIDSDFLFPQWTNLNGTNDNDTYRRRFNRTLHRIFQRSKVQGSGHDLRCTFAVERLEEGASIYDVMLLLGHSNVETTRRYYARWINKDALIERLAGVMEKARFDHFEKVG